MNPNSQFPKKFIFLRSPRLILIGILLPIIIGIVAVWLLWGGEIKKIIKERDIRSRISQSEAPGYVKESITEGREEQGAVFDISNHPIEDVERVVDNVTVRVKTFSTPEEATRNIKEASLVYIWEWQGVTIHGQEAKAGYLRDKTGKEYEAAYLAWVEGPTYFELIARPSEVRDYSDKEFLYRSAREVAESLIKQ